MLRFLLCCPPARLCVGFACVLSLWNTASSIKVEAKKEKETNFLPVTGSVLREERKEEGVALLASTELPARSVDLSALNLTELVNGMLSRALTDGRQFFSLLSITSYSSFAFHKVSVAVYNISNLKTVDPAKFPTRFCYCLNNRTNDLSDFTALLVDVVGNSTGSLTEVFRSTSLLSVSQTEESDCIFICVMAGKAGRNLSDFWELVEKSPVLNYTFTSSLPGVLGPHSSAKGSKRPYGQGEPLVPMSTVSTASVAAMHGGGPVCSHQGNHWDFKTYSPNPANATADKLQLLGPECTPAIIPEDLPLGSRNCFIIRRGNNRAQRPTSRPPSPGHSHPERCLPDPTRREATNGQPWTSIMTVPRDQTIDEKATRGPPWGTRSSPSPSEHSEVLSTRSPLGAAGAMARPSSPAWPSPTSGIITRSTQTPSPTKAPAPKDPQTECPQVLLKEGIMTAAPVTLAIQKLNPCLMELCRFFQQCLCGSQRRNPRTGTTRYCLAYYSWFLKNATFLCERMKLMPHSHSKCLAWLRWDFSRDISQEGAATLKGCPALAKTLGGP
ncbi:HERV-H LTR-associating protein 1 [Ctenodactylus gundi]